MRSVLRLLLMSLGLLGAQDALAADTWAPLANEFTSFTLTKQETVRYGVDTRWDVKTLPAGTYRCDYGFFQDKALGNFTKKCFILVAEVVAPPVVTPPVIPPATPPPAGWTVRAQVGTSFPVVTQTLMKLCTADYGTCTTPVTFYKTGDNGAYACALDSLGFPNAPAAAAVCIGQPKPPEYFEYCGPKMELLPWRMKVRQGVTDSYVSKPLYIVWQGDAACGGGIHSRLYSLADAAIVIAQSFASDAAVQAWIKTQPIEETSVMDAIFTYQTQKAFAIEMGISETPPAALVYTMKVRPIASGTRPYFDLNANGTRGTTERGRVAVNTDCDQNVQVGSTSYYKVPSLGMFAAYCSPK